MDNEAFAVGLFARKVRCHLKNRNEPCRSCLCLILNQRLLCEIDVLTVQCIATSIDDLHRSW